MTTYDKQPTIAATSAAADSPEGWEEVVGMLRSRARAGKLAG